jgi:DNA-binding LacI/PurR family transcriptional regulator
MVTNRSAEHAKATIHDVAKLAGVNASTVSRALGNPGRVSDRTRKLVEDAAAELNYSVNWLARALPTGRTGMVGLILADITNPSYFEIIRGAQAVGAERGLTLVLAESVESGSTESLVAQRMQSSTDGIILASPRMTDLDIRALNGHKPVAVINRFVEGIDSVVPDVEAGISEAVRHLTSNGHQKIAYLSGPEQSWISARRWDTLRSASAWSGRETQLIPTTTPTMEGGRRAARDLIASGATAAVCYNDLLAIGLMQQLRAAGVNVPDDLSVIGFDNIFGSDFTAPALSTIASPLKACGAAALDLILAALSVPDQSRRQLTSRGPSALRTTLLVRGSSGRLLARTG